MSETTILDVSQYARLWRGVWWTQHLVMLLALVVGGLLLGAVIVHLTDSLKALANAQIEEVWRRGLDDARREQEFMTIATLYTIVRDVLGSHLLTVILIITASLALIGTYVLGCRTFRLQLLTVHLVPLAVVAVVFAMSLTQLVRTYNPDGSRVQTLADATLIVICVAIAAPSLILLIVQGVLAWRLWRHHLRPELAPTHLMTRSFGRNLAISRFRMPSPAGGAIHLGLLGVVVGLVLLFFDWLIQALVGGPISLLLLFSLALQPVNMLYRALTGQTVIRFEDFSEVPLDIQNSSRLVVVAVVLIAARAVWRVGTRFNLRQRDAIILKDKPPVLLLRSFVDDVAGIPPNALIPRLLWRRKRLEETIGAELTRAGPFVAIGKPGERLPQLGAHRLYVGDADWQQVVTSYITRAEPIILIAGTTTWVQWELSNIAALGRLNRLLIVFPRSTDAERTARWQNLKLALDGTPWSVAADAIDITGALAVFMQAEGFVVIRSRAAHESDYQGALRVATYLMGRRPEQGTSC
jgi:hypothetical protein